MVRTIVIALISIFFLFLYIRYIERRSLYLPFKDIVETPQSLGLNFVDLNIPTSDGQMLNAWFIPAPNAIRTIFFLHGNGGNLSHRLEKILLFHELGLNVFILDYRGYGKSTGVPSEHGLYRDAENAFDYLTSKLKIQPQDVIIFGESLGSAVAVELLERIKVRALILEGAFTSVAEMSRRIYPFLPTMFISNRFDSISKIKQISIPKLFIHSVNDEVVPFDIGRKLFEAASEPKSFLEIQGGHNDAFFLQEDKIRKNIVAFLDRLGGGS